MKGGIKKIMAKRIGILGGISHESTIKYYELILQKYYQRYNDYYYPEIVIFSLDFQKFTDFENDEDKTNYIDYINQGIQALEKASVEFILMSANSPHAVFNELAKRANVPMLSIVEATAKNAKNKGMKKVLLLGIKFTMQSTFYQDVFNKLGIEVITPTNDQQDEINSIIFDELVIGIFKEESKKRLFDIISNYEIDGVILGCTELPLVLKQSDSAVPLLDTVEIHAEATLNFSLE